MKVLVILLLINFSFSSIERRLKEHNSAMETYLDILSSQFVDDIFEKQDFKMVRELQKRNKIDGKVSARRLGVKKTRRLSLNSVKVGTEKMNRKERRLYESLTASYLLGNNDDTMTGNQLSILTNQQKSMQNFKSISSWVVDIENNLDDMRDSVLRRLNDMSTGLQRRNQLMGHYNDIGNLHG